jgi:penicillin-binding protein-related factor A (putative recombinase)
MVRLRLLRPDQHLTRRELIVHRRIPLIVRVMRVDPRVRGAYLHRLASHRRRFDVISVAHGRFIDEAANETENRYQQRSI